MPKITNQNDSNETSRSEKKLRMIHLYQLEVPITQIARDLNVARKTIYEWLEKAPKQLISTRRKGRIPSDSQLFSQLTELLVVAQIKKIPKLRRALKTVYGVELTEAQIRTRLKLWSLHLYRRTFAYESLKKDVSLV